MKSTDMINRHNQKYWKKRCDETGINFSRFMYAVNHCHIEPEKAVLTANTIPIKDSDGHVFDSINSMCESHGIVYSTYFTRTLCGWYLCEALDRNERRNKIHKLTISGRDYYISDYELKKNDVLPESFRRRLQKGMTKEEALSFATKRLHPYGDLGEYAKSKKASDERLSRWFSHFDIIMDTIYKKGTMSLTDYSWIKFYLKSADELTDEQKNRLDVYEGYKKSHPIKYVKATATLSEVRWEQHLKDAITAAGQYCNGNLNALPQEINASLATWLRKQKNYYKKGKLSKEREERLRKAGLRLDTAGPSMKKQPDVDNVINDCRTLKELRIKYGTLKKIPKSDMRIVNRVYRYLADANKGFIDDQLSNIIFDSCGVLPPEHGEPDFVSELYYSDMSKYSSAFDKSMNIIEQAIDKYHDISNIPSLCVGRYYIIGRGNRPDKSDCRYINIQAKAYELLAMMGRGELTDEQTERVRTVLCN